MDAPRHPASRPSREVALIRIITFRVGKIAHGHIYWDQPSFLVQIGLLDPDKLPVVCINAVRKVLHPKLPSSHLLSNLFPTTSGRDGRSPAPAPTALHRHTAPPAARCGLRR